MEHSQKRIKQLLWFTAGIQTHALYLIIILILLFGVKTDINPRPVLEIFISLLALSLCLSVLTMMKGFNEEKTLNWGLLWLAVFNIPSIVGFIIALTMIL